MKIRLGFMPSRLLSWAAPPALFLVIASALGLVAFYSITLSRDGLSRQAEAEAITIARTNAAYVSQRVTEISDQANNLASALASGRPADASGLDQALTAARGARDGPDRAILTDAQGRLLAASPAQPDLVGSSLAGEDWYRQVSASRMLRVSLGAVAQGRDLRQVSVAVPLAPTAASPWAGSGGYLVGTYYILDSIQQLVDELDRDQGVSMTLIDADGQVIVTPLVDPGTVVARLAGDPILVAALHGRSAVDRRTGVHGEVFTAYLPMPRWGWVAVADAPAHEAVATIDQLQNRVLLIVAVIGLALIAAMIGGTVLLQRAREAVQLEERNRALGRLDEAARTVHSLRGQAALESLAATARGLAGADLCRLTVFRADDSGGLDGVAVSAAAELSQAARAALVEYLDRASSAEGGGEPVSEPGRGAVMTVPLMAGDRVLGRLEAIREAGAPGFDELGLGLLGQISGHAVTIIEKDRRDKEREELLDELQAKNDELERASRLKSQFLANMSHELRTPLNSIIGFSQLLGRQSPNRDEGRARRYVENIESSGRHLLALVNDVLDLSKMAAGRLQLNAEAVELASLIDETLGRMQPQAAEKRLDLSWEVKAGVLVRGDRLRISQIVLNLVSNAIKFTPEGGRVRVSMDRKGAEITLRVEDSGIGIQLEDQERVFEEFTQVDAELVRNHTGTGLGLPFSRGLAELMGGTLELASQPGAGSVFTVTLPAVKTARGV